MNDNFDELAKAMAQPIARREALKRFGVGLAAFALAALGLTNKAHAGQPNDQPGGLGHPCGPGYPPCKRGLVCVFYPGSLPKHGTCGRGGGIGT
jgi:hypothetical protein